MRKTSNPSLAICTSLLTMPQEYKNLVFTTHSLERMKQRTISQHAAWETVTYPDQKKQENASSVRYIKTINSRRHFVVASFLPKEHKYLVISTWVRGEDDAQPLSWQLITLPFRALWWLIKLISSKLR